MKNLNHKTMIDLLWLAGLCTLVSVTSCKQEDETPGNPPSDHQNQVTVSPEDTISRNWEVISATHNGVNDPGSVGLKLSISKNGSYLLISTGYKGTWEFSEQKTKVLLDKNTSAYKTLWTIVSMSSRSMSVTFKSPFTGGSAAWKLKSY